MKPKSLGIILLFLMVTSSLYYFIASFIFQPRLPETNVVDYELDIPQKNLVLRKGMILLEFLYNSSCQDCGEKIEFLDSLASQYKDKIFLEKIKIEKNSTKLRLIGFNITENKIFLREEWLEEGEIEENKVFKLACDLMLSPPVECVSI
ncbi:MAG: hypothetical protein QW451_00015 [Candidatus Aenigmatarchaeota archaeon]